MEFKYCTIDPLTASKDEINQEIERLSVEMHDAYNTQQAYKLFINSAYGAIGNQYFQCYNTDIAEAITLQGQDMIKFMYKAINNYFLKKWHLDKDLHKILGIEVMTAVQEEVTVYGDTDSTVGSTLINVDKDIKLRIDFLWEEYSKLYGFSQETGGHEIILNPNLMVLNYGHNKNIEKTKVTKIVRHKVSKPKWKLKTKSGKEIIITSDHSLVVFRNGQKLEIKPKDVLLTDKILVIK